jgi:iron complex outermembrane receptor protein
MSGQVERWQGGSFIAGKLVLLKQTQLLQEIVLYPSIRVDGFTGTSPAWSPQAALMTRFTRVEGSLSLEPYIRVSASRNFRMPTFNELYYQGGGGFGNPALRPESARSIEIGGGVSAEALGHHVLDFTWFETQMTDRIVWVAAGSFGVTPQNIRNVLSRGFEVSWIWNLLSDAGSLRVGYGNISSRKTSAESGNDLNINTSLVYVPEQTANASLDWRVPVGADWIHALQGEVAYHFVGSRYTSEDNRNELPAYQLLDVSLAAYWGVEAFALSTKLDLLNILNEDYQVILGYPMPMRSIRVTFSMGY